MLINTCLDDEIKINKYMQIELSTGKTVVGIVTGINNHYIKIDTIKYNLIHIVSWEFKDK